jgi:hypothetical protein
MEPGEYVTDVGTDHRPRSDQPEPTGPIGREDPLADHHIEEVLAALNAVRVAEAP